MGLRRCAPSLKGDNRCVSIVLCQSCGSKHGRDESPQSSLNVRSIVSTRTPHSAPKETNAATSLPFKPVCALAPRIPAARLLYRRHRAGLPVRYRTGGPVGKRTWRQWAGPLQRSFLNYCNMMLRVVFFPLSAFPRADKIRKRRSCTFSLIS